MGKSNRKQVYFKLGRAWLQIGIQKRTIRKINESWFSRISKGIKRNYQRIQGTEHHTGGNELIDSFPFLHDKTKRKAAPNFRLEIFKPESAIPSFSNGKLEYIDSTDDIKFTFLQSGLKGCIPLCSNFQGTSEIFRLHFSESRISVQSSPFWTFNSTAHLYQNHARSDLSTSCQWDEISRVLGRHYNYWRLFSRSNEFNENSYESSSKSWLYHKQQEINPQSKASYRIHWNGSGCNETTDSNSTGENQEADPRLEKVCIVGQNISEKVGLTNWLAMQYSIRLLSSIYPSTVDTTKCISVHEERQLGEDRTDLAKLQDGNAMVATKSLSSEWKTDTESFGRDRDLHGCIAHGMGSSLQGYGNTGKLELLGTTAKLQLQRAEGCSVSSAQTQFELDSGKDTSFQERQYDCSLSIESAEQSGEYTSSQLNKRNLEFLFEETSDHQSNARKRKRESLSGQTQSAKSIQQSSALEFKQRCDKDNKKIYWRFSNRFIRNSSKQQTRTIYNSVSKQMESIIRCDVSSSMARSCTGASSQHHDWQGYKESSAVPLTFDSSHSIVENASMVSNGHSPQCQLPNCINGEIKQNETEQQIDRLDYIRKSSTYQKFSPEAKALLEKAERKQTKKSYQSAWHQFCDWCHKQFENPCDFKISNAINYLAYLSSTKPNSVTLHRSAISSTWKILFPELPTFGENELTKRFMKGINESYPKKPKNTENDWCIQQVLEVCKTIDNNTCTINDLSSKTSILLALATFWRPRSDLARIEFKNVIFKEIYFKVTASQPKEGDFKTTTVYKCSDQDICPYVCLKKYIERTAETRQGSNSSKLFIVTSKQTHDASGDTIARWIKQIFHRANINANVHSTRSVASTLAKEMGIAQEEILARANWKSERTFKNHYYRPALKHPNHRVHEVNDVHSEIYDNMKNEYLKFILECTSERSELDALSHPPLPSDFSMARDSVLGNALNKD